MMSKKKSSIGDSNTALREQHANMLASEMSLLLWYCLSLSSSYSSSSPPPHAAAQHGTETRWCT